MTIHRRRPICKILVLTMTLGLLCMPAHADEYLVQVGDVLHIQVMGEDALTNTFTVAPDGQIPFPMIGMVAAEDRTLDKIAHAIGDRLANGYLRYPQVTVSLEKRTDPKFFVYGEVKTPGEYALTIPPITVIQAVAMAGGLSKSGSESKITVMRQKPDNSGYQLIKVDVKKIVTKGEDDPVVHARDIVLVREGWF